VAPKGSCSHHQTSRTRNSKSGPSSHSPSERLSIDFRDYNIFHIDSKIREKLISNISSIEELEKDLQKTLWILTEGDDPIQKVLAKRQASLLRRRIQDLESTIELSLYIFRTHDLIESYRQLLKNSGEKSFINIAPACHDANAEKMERIVSRYLCIAQEYVEITNLSQRPKKMVCPACHSLEFRVSPDDDSIFLCVRCSTEQEIIDDTPNFKDTDRVNMSSKYTYSRKGHFIDAKKRFQGIQNTDPEKIHSAVKIIEREMKLHNLVAEQGTRKSVSKDHIYDFLSEQNLSHHYEDLNLIHHIITGEQCPDISMYDVELDELFDQQEVGLEQVKDEDRTNSLNVNFKLYKLLQKVGYRCQRNDFYILKTQTKLDAHEEVLKRGWELLGWKWIPSI
jgi:hypothetical protein